MHFLFLILFYLFFIFSLSAEPLPYLTSEIVRYTYGSCNHYLLTKYHNHKKKISYTYVPHTNRLEKKLTFADGSFVEREFYQYDSNSILIQKIVDDGSSSEKDDLTNVSYRLITDIVPQLNPDLAGMTFPCLVKKSYIDLETGEKKLLKMIENIYSYGDLLSEEKIYDANENYGYSRFFEYEKRRLTSMTDAMGNKTIYRYDENGNKIEEEKLGTGKKMQFVYDTCDRLIQTIEHTDIALIKTYTYDNVGNPIKVKDHFGQETTFQYDSQNREISSTDPHGFTHKKEYDLQGNIVQEIDKDGFITKTIYNTLRKPLKIIYPDNSTKRFCYDLQGYLIQEWQRDGLSTTYDVDYQGRPKVIKTYSSNGDLLKETKAIYKGNNLLSEINAMGHITNYFYDGAGRLIKKIQEDQITSYEYDALGNLFKTTCADSVEIKIHDFLNRVIEERTEDLNGNIYRKKEFAYDIHGNQILEKVYQDDINYSETKTLFNPRNEPIEIINALGKSYKTTYHYSDHLEKETLDPYGRKTVEIFDAVNKLSATKIFSSTHDFFYQSYFAYDGRGNKTFEIYKILAQNQEFDEYVIETTFDGFSQMVSAKEQGNKMTWITYQYEKLKQVIQPNGVIVHYTYDALGRLIDLKSSDHTIHYRYIYDLDDNILDSEDLTLSQKAAGHIDEIL